MAKKSRVSRSELEAQITTDLRKAFEKEIFRPARAEFRSSSLPFCPRKYVIHRRYGGAVHGESYGFTFYVTIGTAIHEAVQTFLGANKLLYGHWTCCGLTEYNRLGSRPCPICGGPQKYEELAPKSALGMHVDGVVPRYNGIFEFKSIGAKRVDPESPDELKDPYEKHMLQASCYVHALNEEHGWELDKIIFVYFSRDDPKKFKVFVRRPLPTIYSDSLVLYRKTLEDLESGVIPEGICSSASVGRWEGCVYAGICFSPWLEDQLLPVSSLLRKT